MTVDGNSQERRVGGRVEEILTGWWRLEGGKFERCKTLDISIDGALIVLGGNLPEGTQFELHLDFEADWSAEFNARVLWQRPIFFGKQQLTAVSYRTKKPADQSMLGLWLQRNLKAKGKDTGSPDRDSGSLESEPKSTELKPITQPAPRVSLIRSPWKRLLMNLTAKIPWLESEPIPNERRKEPRGQVGLSLICRSNDQEMRCEFLNISLSGASVFLPASSNEQPGLLKRMFEQTRVETGEVVELVLSPNSLLIGGERCRAEVVWTHFAEMEREEELFGLILGLRFKTQPAATKKTFVGDLLRRINYNPRQVRGELRLPAEIPIRVTTADNREVKGVTRDISAGGASIQIDEALDTPSSVVLHLNLPMSRGGISQIRLSGRLLRQIVDKEERNCYAVAFRKGQTRENLALSRWLAGKMRVQDLDELVPNFSVMHRGDAQ